MSVTMLSSVYRAPRAQPWLITFVDLVLLLLSFFVLMFSMSQPDAVRYASIVQSYAEAFRPGLTVDATFINSRTYVLEDEANTDEMTYLQAAFKAAFARSPNLDAIQFRANERALMILLPNATANKGTVVSADLKPALFDLGGVLANIDNRLAVIGLADTTAESWSNGLRRAALIADALKRAGYDRPIATLARMPAVGGIIDAAGNDIADAYIADKDIADKENAIEIMIMSDHSAGPERAP